MAMSTASMEKAFAGKAFTSAPKPALRARVSRSPLVCKAAQVLTSPFDARQAGVTADRHWCLWVRAADKQC